MVGCHSCVEGWKEEMVAGQVGKACAWEVC